jgi:hypothetical protein
MPINRKIKLVEISERAWGRLRKVVQNVGSWVQKIGDSSI